MNAKTIGRSAACKNCTKKDAREREKILRSNPEWVEKEKKRAREKYHRLGYKDKHKPNPEKKKTIIENYKNMKHEKYKRYVGMICSLEKQLL